MAKKKKSLRKKHNSNDSDQDQEFLSNVPEKSEQSWDEGSELPQNTSSAHDLREESAKGRPDEQIIDPIAERMMNSSSETPEGYFEETQPEEQILDEQEEASSSSEQTMLNEETTPQPSFTVGTFLKQERENQGISLKNVSQSTKISLTNLEFLEKNNLTALPDKAYVTGYVKSYAKLLGVDISFCLNLLDKTYNAAGIKTLEPDIVIPQAQNSPRVKGQFPLGKIASIAAMVIITVGVVGFFMTRDKAPQPQLADEYAREIEEKEEEEVSLEDPEIRPQTLSAETPLQENVKEDTPSSDENTATNEESATEEAVEESSEEKEIAESEKDEEKEEGEKEEGEKKRKFYPLADSLYSIDTEMSEEKQNELLPESFRVTPQEGIQAVYITASEGDSWLTYKSDNDPIKKFVLKKGRSLLFRAKNARLFLGNLGAVKIFLNNKPLKVTSRTGVKSLVFPQSEADEYVMPLFIYKEDGSVITSEEYLKKQEEN